MTFSGRGQGTAAASPGGSGDVSGGLGGTLAPGMLPPGLRGAGALGCAPSAFQGGVSRVDGKGAEERGQGGYRGGPFPPPPAPAASSGRKADGEVGFSRLPLGPPSS